SEMMEEARKMGIPVAREGYADREHTEDGSLVLVRKGETIENYEEMAQRVVRMVRDKQVITFDNKDASIEVDTVCIHADTPDATTLAKAIVDALEQAKIELTPVKKIIYIIFNGCYIYTVYESTRRSVLDNDGAYRIFHDIHFTAVTLRFNK